MNPFIPLLVCATFSLTACSRPSPPEEPVRAVKVLTVGFDKLSSGFEFSGDVRARFESQLGFRVGGKIIKRQAELGEHVKAGQVLAQLDSQDLQSSADAARAQLRAATANRDLALADFKRYQALKQQNFISSAELERRESTLKSAQAQVEQAQAQQSVQGNQARYALLVSDTAGVVTAIEAEPGQVVSAGTPVVRVAADGARDVVFAVPEDRLRDFRPGVAVQVKSWAQDAASIALTATVREVAASADPVTRTYLVKVALQAGEQPLPLGATVNVLAPQRNGASAQVIKLPTSALRQDGQQTAVWVLDRASMTLRSQPVQVARTDGNDVVIASGLQPGLLVVSAGVHVLSPGQKVSIYDENKASASVPPTKIATDSVADSVAVKPSSGTAVVAPAAR